MAKEALKFIEDQFSEYGDFDRIELGKIELSELFEEYASTKEPKPCKWKINEDGAYETECDNIFEFTSGSVKENKAKYCQYCGGLIK